jgi:hypothetical protein
MRGASARPPSGYKTGPAYVHAADFALEARPAPGVTSTPGLLFGLAPDDGFGALLMHDEGKKDRVALAAVSFRRATRSNRTTREARTRSW